MRTAALHNLGCKVNAYETEAMEQLLEEAGYKIVPFTEPADVYVINTCSVTNMADRKSRQMLHRARKQNPRAILVAAGCYVQTASTDPSLEDVDLLIGNNQKHNLVPLLKELEDMRSVEEKKIQAVDDISGKTEYESLFLSHTGERTRAFVKVQDGCNQFCSYCIIPYARGRVRSRNLSDVLTEIRGLVEKGYQEVVLTGIHLSSYGVDCEDNLLHLIQEVHNISGLKRIRLGSLEPKIVTEEFARELSKLSKVCPHFHLSLQSGCDATLKRMNRKYTTEEYKEGCRLLCQYFTHPAITTDVIVGFPGETEEEFAQTRAFLEEIRFYEVHIFKYSKRKGTRAAEMKDQIPEPVKSLRSDLLFSDTEKTRQEFEDWYEGKEVSVLLEEPVSFGGKEYLMGHTPEYLQVAVAKEQGEANTFVTGIAKKKSEKSEAGFGKDRIEISPPLY